MSDIDDINPEDVPEHLKEDLIDEIADARDNDVREPVQNQKDVHKGVGLKTVLFSSALAAILGISGGTYFGGMAAKQPAPDISKIQASIQENFGGEIDRVKKDVGKLTAKLERLERDVEIKSGTSMSTPSNATKSDPGLSSNISDLTDIETRLASLEASTELANSSSTEVADLSDFSERLETLEKTAFEPATLDGLEALRERLTELETQLAEAGASETETLLDTAVSQEALTDLQTSLDERLTKLETAEVPELPSVDLTPLSARMDALENRVDNLPLVLPPFPRQAVLDALEATKSDGEKGGWLSRTIGQQVVVQDADILARLDRIESNVGARNITAVKKDVASLPDSAQTALKSWLADIEKIGNAQ